MSSVRPVHKWLVVLAVAGLGVFAWWRFRPDESVAAPKWQTAAADRGQIVAKITATGTVSPLKTVQVGSQVSGRILELYVDFNSTVKKGDRIATIDPQLIKASVGRARANLSAARADLQRARALAKDAERQAERARSLAERKLVAQSEADTAASNAEAARAQVIAAGGSVEQASAALEEAELNLTYTTIYSPIDGIVISRSVDVGQTVAASLQAPTLFAIAEDLRKMQVNTSVSESDVGRLADGMQVQFTVDAYPGKRFRGKVRQIRNSPTTVQNVVTYDAVIDVDNPGLELKPGMTANVTFIIGEKEDALRVANAALRFRPPAGALPARPAPAAPAAPAAKPSSEASAPAAAPAARDRSAEAAAPAARDRSAESAAPAARDRSAESAAPAARDRSAAEQDPSRKTIWKLVGDELVPVRVRIGLSDGSSTEILEGELAAGDLVVTGAAAGTAAGASAAPARSTRGGRSRGPL